MDGISRSRGWDKEIPHCVLLMEQLVLSDKWARISDPECMSLRPIGRHALRACRPGRTYKRSDCADARVGLNHTLKAGLLATLSVLWGIHPI